MTSKGTARRSVRIPDDEWEAAQEAARLLGVTVSDLVRHALSDAVRRARQQQPSGPPSRTGQG